ncbi:MAG: hypothetical protein WCL18_08975 [bacterium]
MPDITYCFGKFSIQSFITLATKNIFTIAKHATARIKLFILIHKICCMGKYNQYRRTNTGIHSINVYNQVFILHMVDLYSLLNIHKTTPKNIPNIQV